jgi:hypothetical protein
MVMGDMVDFLPRELAECSRTRNLTYHTRGSPTPSKYAVPICRRVQQIIVLADGERCHLVEQLLLAGFDAATAIALEPKTATGDGDTERRHSGALVLGLLNLFHFWAERGLPGHQLGNAPESGVALEQNHLWPPNGIDRVD